MLVIFKLTACIDCRTDKMAGDKVKMCYVLLIEAANTFFLLLPCAASNQGQLLFFAIINNSHFGEKEIKCFISGLVSIKRGGRIYLMIFKSLFTASRPFSLFMVFSFFSPISSIRLTT